MRLLALRTVVVATDLDRSSDAALDTAHRLARASGAALHVVHAVVPTQAGEADPLARDRPAEAAVWAALQRAGVSDEELKIHLVAGPPAEVIRLFADRVAADVVVVGSRQRDHSGPGHHLGGTARAVVERAFAPCLVAIRPLRLPLERVLVPIDSSETARGALVAGLSWASALRRPDKDDRPATLTVLHVDTAGDAVRGATPPAVDRELAILGKDAGSWAGVDIRGITTNGADAAEAIAAYTARNAADLVVVGTRGLGLNEVARLGSVSASLTARLPYPILLVPPAVWRAYATVS
jgi:nucleotide-binding universal stress UspA family protein